MVLYGPYEGVQARASHGNGPASSWTVSSCGTGPSAYRTVCPAPGKMPASYGMTRTVTLSRSLISTMCSSCSRVTLELPKRIRSGASWMIAVYKVGLSR
ncbi:hypothetical protein AQJ91_25110 [Streptomyces dysideae]|uniref:Uncharacterized protein n=1 Tax=Streptomyces dysideae TaxID=909626 RepID=A0A124IEJ5_9ACTN|nr:hypothetical protein AQJ91_25110 [Streptomyces dysideae]